MLKIVNVPNQILTVSAKPVVKIDQKILTLIGKMDKTLAAQVDPQGVGLAAPQVGENLAIFVIKPNPGAKTEAFINPKVIKHETGNIKHAASGTNQKKARTKLEGCLSIPRIWGPVKRSGRILLEYQTVTGQKKTAWFSGFKAVIIQHEVDHLNGILFTQRSLEQKAPLYEEKGGKLEKISNFV